MGEPTPERELYAALVEFRKECPRVLKRAEGQVGRGRYNYATLDDIVDAISPVLAKHGLSFLQPVRTHFVDGKKMLALETRIVHQGGGMVSSTFETDLQQDMQKFGSQLTYAKRYCLSSMLGIATDEDDDGAESVKAPQQQANQHKPKQQDPSKPEVDGWIVSICAANDMQQLRQAAAFIKERGYEGEVKRILLAAYEKRKAQILAAEEQIRNLEKQDEPVDGGAVA